MEEFDLIVIGSGPGGYISAIRASQLGLKTAVVDKEKNLGGACLNVGCIPSKALLESSERYKESQHSLKRHGVYFKELELDLKQMMKRKQNIVSELTGGIQFLFKKNKITRFQSWGAVISPHEVQIDKKIIRGKNILLATGSAPIELPFAPFDKDIVVSSTEALSFQEVPKKMVVVGAGYIGLELGSVWSRLGSEVTILEAGSHICSSMDRELSEKLFQILKKQGLQIYLNSKLKQVETKKKTAELQFQDGEGKKQSLACDKVLIAVGRRAFTKKLGLEKLGILTNPSEQVVVDQQFRTTQKNVFAIGDLIAGPMLAHKAEEEGVAVAEIIGTGYGHVNYNTIPSVIYTCPEAASVGQTEEQLIKDKREYLSGSFPFSANGRAKALADTEGFVKVLVAKKTDRILGVHIIGPRAGDLIAEAVVAMEFKASSEDLARSFHAHPTLSEALREASLAVHKRARQF